MGEIAQDIRTQIIRSLIESVPRTVVPQPTYQPQEKSEPVPEPTKEQPKKEEKKPVKKIRVKGTVKEAEAEKTEEPINENLYLIDGIHLELYNWFKLSPSMVGKQDLKDLQNISSYFYRGDIKKTLNAISRVETNIGRRFADDERLSVLSNYVRLKRI